MIRRLIILLLIVGCVPLTISNIQSAKIVDKGKVEFTPSVSTTLNTFNLGVQTAYGLNRKSNLRFRLERIFIDACDRDDNCENSFFNYKFNLTHLSFGLKYQLIKNKSAIYLPISFTKEDESADILKLIEPTYIHTFSSEKNTGIINEFTLSIKALYPFRPETKVKDALLVYSIGLGISGDIDKWVIRPELSFLGGGVGFPLLSIGLSIYP